MVLSERLDEPRDQVIARLRHRLEKEKPVTDFVPRAKEIPVGCCNNDSRSHKLLAGNHSSIVRLLLV